MMNTPLSLIGSDPWCLWKTLSLNMKGLNAECFFEDKGEDDLFLLSELELKLLEKKGFIPEDLKAQFKSAPWILKTPSFEILLGRDFTSNLNELKRKTNLGLELGLFSKEEVEKNINSFSQWIFNIKEKKSSELYQLWAKDYKLSGIFKLLIPTTEMIDLDSKKELVNLFNSSRILEEHWLVYDQTIEESFYSLIQLLNPWWSIKRKDLTNHLLHLLKNKNAVHFTAPQGQALSEIFFSEQLLKEVDIFGKGHFKKLKTDQSNSGLVIVMNDEPWINSSEIYFGTKSLKFVFDSAEKRHEHFPVKIKFPSSPDLVILSNPRLVLGGPIKYRALGRLSFILNDLL